MEKDAECTFVYVLDLTDVEFLDDSSTESLLLSGDEYNQDFDSTNFEESQDEDEALNEIVRCVCELDEENGFMIQVGRPPSHTESVTPADRRVHLGSSCLCTNCPAPDGGFRLTVSHVHMVMVGKPLHKRSGQFSYWRVTLPLPGCLV